MIVQITREASDKKNFLVHEPTLGTNILGNLLHWAENKRQLNFLEIGYQLVIAHSGSGIQSMQGTTTFTNLECAYFVYF